MSLAVLILYILVMIVFFIWFEELLLGVKKLLLLPENLLASALGFLGGVLTVILEIIFVVVSILLSVGMIMGIVKFIKFCWYW